MKILLANLLLVIEFFVCFREVNSSPMYAQGSIRLNSGNPYVKFIRINYKDMPNIQVEVNTLGGLHTPIRCDYLGGEQRGIPSAKDRRAGQNFITRAVYENNIKYCVIYETENGEVLGVKVPPPNSQHYDGEPSHLNPDNEKYFITYKGRDYEVTVWPNTGFKLEIKLLPENKELNQFLITKYGIKPESLSFAGIHFNVHVKTKEVRADMPWAERIVAADLI